MKYVRLMLNVSLHVVFAINGSCEYCRGLWRDKRVLAIIVGVGIGLTKSRSGDSRFGG